MHHMITNTSSLTNNTNKILIEYRRTNMQLHFFYKPALSTWMHVQSLLYAFLVIWQENTLMEFKQDREVIVISLQQGWRDGR